MVLVALLLFRVHGPRPWLAQRLCRSFRENTRQTVALGGTVFGLVGLIPSIGTAALILVAAFSAGATLLSRFGRTQAVAVEAEPPCGRRIDSSCSHANAGGGGRRPTRTHE